MESLASRLAELIAADSTLRAHPCRTQLAVVLGGETSTSSAGFPYISEASFRVFVDQVPHLFADGQALLEWLELFERLVAARAGLSDDERDSIARAVKVSRNMVCTAAVTAPPDLWVLRQVLAADRRAGLIDELLGGRPSSAEDLAAGLGLNPRQVGIDLQLLTARGYLERHPEGLLPAERPSVAEVLRETPDLPEAFRLDWVAALVDLLRDGTSEAPIEGFLGGVRVDASTGTWIASVDELEAGFRLLPVLLALHLAGRLEGLLRGERPEIVVGTPWELLQPFLEAVGFVSEGAISELGARVCARGPGPFGIVAAYQPYFARLDDLLSAGTQKLWVRRANNVAASQYANRKTFRVANAALDRFCADWSFEYTVFIEHAVGQGEAVRQRFKRDGEASIRYFGADLEDAAIDQAIRQQRLGVLPRNMEFVRGADIGEPARVTEYLESRGVEAKGAVMMVGNGFHEIRDKTSETMRRVFAAYQEAGILLVFTEETALSDDELVSTAWNTYHAGFRYVHQMSGQRLRSTWGAEADDSWGWRRLATAGGYLVLEEYCYRTRTIYPLPRPDRRNPAISMSYFCVPADLAAELGIPSDLV